MKNNSTCFSEIQLDLTALMATQEPMLAEIKLPY